MNFFALLCGLLTVSLGSYWCYQFSLNEDLTSLKYKEFHGTKEDNFPTVSFCLGNPFLKEKLAEYGVDEPTYSSFLGGKSFSNEMMNINFSYVTIDITDYIEGYHIHLQNDTSENWGSSLTLQQKKMLIFTSFIGFMGNKLLYKCFALNVPEVLDLERFQLFLSNKIFPNGVTPTKNIFKTFVHSPKQFLLPGNTFISVWPYRSSNESYAMYIILYLSLIHI